LRLVFIEFKANLDHFLYLAAGKCNGCDKSKSGFSFIGNNSGNYFTLIFDIEYNKILDLYECSNLKMATKTIKLNERIFIVKDFSESELPF
jgi:hypothetical protein